VGIRSVRRRHGLELHSGPVLHFSSLTYIKDTMKLVQEMPHCVKVRVCLNVRGRVIRELIFFHKFTMNM